ETSGYDPWDGPGSTLGRQRADRPVKRRSSGPAAELIPAPMPPTVLKVHVRAGDRVEKGDTVVLLEAMKMELPVRAPADATVAAVFCREGDLVQAEATLVELR